MKNQQASRLVTIVGGTIGLSIVGDSLLYTILPLEAENLGISLPLIGVLLSANRLIRLISNTWASIIFERLGPYWPFLISTIIALFSTTLYGLGWGFMAFLLARIIWGISWSGLRQGGFVAIWTGTDNVKGRLTGLLWGLIRLGSATSVLLGGYLYDHYGYGTTIMVIIGITLLAIPVATLIRWPQQALEKTDANKHDGQQRSIREWLQLNWQEGRLLFQKDEHRWLLGAGFLGNLMSGTLIATTSIFIATRLTNGAPEDSSQLIVLGIGVGTISGLLHGTRWLTDLVLGPLVGTFSDRWGQANTALWLSSLYLLLLFVVVMASPLWAIIGLLLALICDGSLHITLAAAASGAATETPRPHLFAGFFSTATDT